MEKPYAQFTDLTEFPDFARINPDPYYREKDEYVYKPEDIKTEFSFYLGTQYNIKQNQDYLAECGFKPVATMNNWWPSHNGEARPLTLFWKHEPDKPNLVEKPKRVKWYMKECLNGELDWKSICTNLAGSGCGLKLYDSPTKPPKKDSHAAGMYRFFSLVRMPVKVGAGRAAWLKDFGYHQFDVGKQASYWINGWDPAKWTMKDEYAHFKTTKEEWEEKGMEGWTGKWGDR